MPLATNKLTSVEASADASPLPLLRNRDYLLLWGGQTLSSVGAEASQLACPRCILGLTPSPAQAGIGGALRSLAYLLLGLPAGALIDRWDRRRAMIVCDVGRASALGSVALALAIGRLTLAQIY